MRVAHKGNFEKTIAYYGRLDVQVNNAGYEGPNAAITDQTYDNFIGVYNINVFGPFFGMKYAMKQMIAQEKGAIVNIASNGSFVGAAGMSPYVSSKHAVLGLSKCAALEGAAHGIHVNCICPGAINTPMMRKIKKTDPYRSRIVSESCMDLFLYKRFCHPFRQCRSTQVRRHRQRKIRGSDFSLASQDACAPSQASGVKIMLSSIIFTLLSAKARFSR